MKKTLLIAILALVTQLTFAQSLPSYVPTNGLVGYWGFNGNANDESGNGNNGSVNGSVQLTTDRFGNSNSSYLFPGNSSSYISVPGSQQLQIQSEITISAWILMDGGYYNPRIIDYGNHVNSGYSLIVSGVSNVSRTLTGLITNVGGLGVGLSSELNSLVWNHVCFVANSNGSGKLYINGVLVSTVNDTVLNNVSYIGDLNIGRMGHPAYDAWGGKLDDIGVWNRALTQEEITQLYTTTPAPTEVAIGTQTWTTKNLDVATYSDGTIIPQVTNPTEWANLTTGAWCYYDNDPVNGATYGKLYNWYAVAGIWNEASKTDATQRKKLAPTGYHVPSDDEWTTLTEYLGGTDVAGGKMKATTLWNILNQDATNSSGFTGLPGGYRYPNGTFGSIGNGGSWWSSSELDTTYSWFRHLYYNSGNAYSFNDYKQLGFTVRFLMDTTPNPTASAQNFCGATTVASLVATGTDLKWYATETGGIALASDTTLASGTYYVSQTLNTIESDRTAVVVTVNEAQITASANTISVGTVVTLTASSASTGSSILPANLQNGLVGYWPFNGDANDASGNGNNGTVNGATLTTDRFGNANNAYNFDGNNFISTNIIPSNISQRAYSAWFKTTTGGAIIGSNSANNTSNLVLAIHTNGTSYGNEGTALWVVDSEGSSVGWMSSLPTNNLYNDNLWHNITGVFNAISGNIISPSNLSLYVDGVLITIIEQNVNPSISPINILNNIVFGYNNRWISNGYGVKFDGVLDDISIWNRALSPSEITQLYIPAPTYLWSTGETTATINPSPTATTTYWCDVTANGVTCRKEMTIIVKLAVISPINYCHKSTAVPLTATPTNGSTLKWYTTATSKTALPSAPTPTTTPVGSKTYYVAERTAAGVESERLPIVVNVNPLPSRPAVLQLTEGGNSITKVGPYIGTTTSLTLSTSATNATSFDWILPKGVVVTSAVNSSTTDADGVTTANASENIIIDFSGVTTGLGTLFISVTSVGNCGISAERKIALTRVLPRTPVTISTTNANVCFGIVGSTNKVTYSIYPVEGAFADGYFWTVPTGATIETPVANALTMTYGTEIEVSYDSSFVSGAVSVKASNGVGMSNTRNLSVVRRVPTAIASITGPITFCANETATITVPSVPGVTYSWSATNGTNLTTQGTSVTASFENTSTISAYTSVTVSQNNGCGYGASKKLTLRRGSCANAKIASQANITPELFTAMAYPNPSSTAFEVSTNTEKAFEVKAYDLLGRLIEKRHTKESTMNIGANYPSGTYILKISQGENQKTLQVIKK